MVDLVLCNGNVLTQANTNVAAAVGVRGGRIACVGSTSDVLQAAGPATRKLDLAGRTLLPGFNYAHAHIWKIGHLCTTMLDLRSTRSVGEVRERVCAFGTALPNGSWLLGRGYNEALFPDARPPTRADLDAASPDRPVVLTRTCGHICAVNSLALQRAGIDADTRAPAGGIVERDERGQPTGLMHETAMGLINAVIPPPTSADYEAMIVAACGINCRSGSRPPPTVACPRPCSTCTAISTRGTVCRRG